MRSRRGALKIGAAPAMLFSVLVVTRAHGAASSAETALLPITLEVEGCDDLDQAELNKLLAIEFRTLDVLPAEPRERVQIRCSEQRAVVRLQAGGTSNELDLGATTSALWPRLLALSVSEIVTESRARITPVAARPASPEAAPTPPGKPTRPARDTDRFRVFAGASLRRAIRPATWLAGPDLGSTLDLNRYFSLALDLRLEFGRADTELAKIDWLSASGAFAVLAGASTGDWHFAIGPGVTVGYLRLSPQVHASGVTGHAVSGVWAGPALVARARFDLGKRWFALGSVDAGFASTSVAGLVNGEERAVDTGGAWVSAMLGAGLLL